MPMIIDPLEVLPASTQVTALALAADGSWLAWGDEQGNVSIHQKEGGDAPSFTVDGGVSHIAISDQGMLIVGSHSGDLFGHERLGGRRWTHSLGGGCDHLAASASGDLIASIDGARLLHLLTSEGRLLGHHQQGELMLLAVARDGQLVAVADDEGNVTVLSRDGEVRFRREQRGESGERVTALEFLADGHLCIAREALGVTLGDEEEIALEWWNPLGTEVGRVELGSRCEVLSASGGGVDAGMFDGKVLHFAADRSESLRHRSVYSISDLSTSGDDLLVASWFQVRCIDAAGDERWQVEHVGLTQMLRVSSDGRTIAVAGDNQNDYTRENQVLLIDANATPYLQQEGEDIDADLAAFGGEESEDTARITDETAYADTGGAAMETLLTEDEWKAWSGDGGDGDGDSGQLLDLLEQEITLTDATEADDYDIMEGLADSGGIGNLPPVSDAGEDQVVAADEDGTVVVLLDGSHSYDEDGEIVKHVWRDESNRVLGEVAQVKVKLARGNHTFTLTVTDDDGASTGDTVTVQVQ